MEPYSRNYRASRRRRADAAEVRVRGQRSDRGHQGIPRALARRPLVGMATLFKYLLRWLRNLQPCRRPLRVAQIGALLICVATATAQAQTVYIWTGDNGRNGWSKKKNWLNDIAPIPGRNVWLQFRGNIDPIDFNDFANGSDFAGFIFSGTTTPFFLSGNSIDLFGGVYNLDTYSQTVSFDSLNLAGAAVDFGNIGDLTVTSPLVGSGALIKTMSGTLFLQGANSYTGGTEIREGTIEIAAPQNLGSGPLTLAGGALRINNPGTSVVTLPQNIVVEAPSTMTVAQGEAILSGAISGDSRLIVSGAGILHATVDSAAFTSGIDVQSATLLLTGTRYVPVDVHGGEADIDGSVGDVHAFDGGTVGVGDPLAAATLRTLNFILDAGARLSLDIGGTTPGATIGGHDRLNVFGSVSLGGTLDLEMLSGYIPNFGERFFLISNDGTDPIAGAFGNAPNGGIVSNGSLTFSVSYNGDAATGQTVGGNDLVIIRIPSIPETRAVSLGGVGMLVLLRSRRRMRARRSI